MKYLLLFCSILFSTLSLAGEKEGYHTSDSVKWNGPSPHPAKKLSYLESKIVPECQAVYVYFSPKGTVKHSPEASVITAAFCIDRNKVGKGINAVDVCEVMNVDWDKGIYTSFYGGANRLVAKGSCTKETLEKFSSTIKRQSQAMARIDSKFAIMSDKMGFKQIFDSKKSEKEIAPSLDTVEIRDPKKSCHEGPGEEESFEGSIDREAVRSTFRRNSEKFQECCKLNPVNGSKVNVTLNFDIGDQGRITKIEINKEKSSKTIPELAACVSNLVKLTRFPDPSEGTTATVQYSLLFSAP
jgi:hypothetical protein